MTADQNRSPLAVQVGDLHPDPPRAGKVHGLAVHCTGRGIVERARRRGEDPLEHALAYYQAASCSCHYLIGYDGVIIQITADDRRVPHIGVSSAEHSAYLSGAWAAKLPATGVKRWRSRWALRGYKSPQHLFPGPTPNGVYVGAELLPLVPARTDGLWYSDEQHQAVARLALDLAARHGFEVDLRLAAAELPLPCSRLLGHEDLDAFGRWDKNRSGQGWDPGALRDRPRFLWDSVRRAIEAAG